MAHELIEAWRKHLALDRRRSAHTVRAYMAGAERLAAFLSDHHGQAVDAALLARVDQADLRAFLAKRRMEGIGNASAARELSAVRGFLRFVGGEDARVPAMKGPRVKRGLPRPVSPDEAVALAQEIAEGAREPDWAGVLALSGTHLHLYGKTEARRARKMGHLTVTGATAEAAHQTALKAAAILGIEPF